MHLRETVYIDTSIVSAYFDDRIPYQKNLTRFWWDSADIRREYHFCISIVTLEELKAIKDSEKRKEFLKIVDEIEILEFNPDLESIAQTYLSQGALRKKSFADALHVAYSSVHNVNFLVTWNISDLASPLRRRRLKAANLLLGLSMPEIITPEFFEV